MLHRSPWGKECLQDWGLGHVLFRPLSLRFLKSNHASPLFLNHRPKFRPTLKPDKKSHILMLCEQNEECVQSDLLSLCQNWDTLLLRGTRKNSFPRVKHFLTRYTGPGRMSLDCLSFGCHFSSSREIKSYGWFTDFLFQKLLGKLRV